MKRVVTLLVLVLLSSPARADRFVLSGKEVPVTPESLAFAKQVFQSAKFTQDNMKTPVRDVIDGFTASLTQIHVIVELTDPLKLEIPPNRPEIVRGYFSYPDHGGCQVYAIDTSGRILQLSKISFKDCDALLKMIVTLQPDWCGSDPRPSGDSERGR